MLFKPFPQLLLMVALLGLCAELAIADDPSAPTSSAPSEDQESPLPDCACPISVPESLLSQMVGKTGDERMSLYTKFMSQSEAKLNDRFLLGTKFSGSTSTGDLSCVQLTCGQYSSDGSAAAPGATIDALMYSAEKDKNPEALKFLVKIMGNMKSVQFRIRSARLTRLIYLAASPLDFSEKWAARRELELQFGAKKAASIIDWRVKRCETNDDPTACAKTVANFRSYALSTSCQPREIELPGKRGAATLYLTNMIKWQSGNESGLNVVGGLPCANYDSRLKLKPTSVTPPTTTH